MKTHVGTPCLAEEGSASTPPLYLLTAGSHRTRSEGLDAMEAVAALAGEAHTSDPACACAVLTRYVHVLNDAAWSSDRARTLAFTPWLIPLGSSRQVTLRGARGAWLAARTIHWAERAVDLAAAVLAEAGTPLDAMREDPLQRQDPLARMNSIAQTILGIEGAERCSFRYLLQAVRGATECARRAQDPSREPEAQAFYAASAALWTSFAAVRAAQALWGIDPLFERSVMDACLRAAVEDIGPLLVLSTDPS